MSLYNNLRQRILRKAAYTFYNIFECSKIIIDVLSTISL